MKKKIVTWNRFFGVLLAFVLTALSVGSHYVAQAKGGTEDSSKKTRATANEVDLRVGERIESLTVPNADISISPSKGNATWDWDMMEQKTNTFTLNGDYRNAVTIRCPEGVTFHNETKGVSGQGTVNLNGGDSFHLTAGREMAGSMSIDNILGTMTRSWRAIVFNQQSTSQTMGSYSGSIDPASPTSFAVVWNCIKRMPEPMTQVPILSITH